jgi:hypothetical protein
MAAAVESAAEDAAPGRSSVGRSYTRGRTSPYLIRKWPGSRVTLPMGPYTLTQLVILVGTGYLLINFSDYWAFFGGFNIVIGVGLPVGLTYAARHTRVEGRDPLRAGLALVTYLLQPRSGLLRGRGWRAAAPVRVPGRAFVVVDLPAAVHPAAARTTSPARAAARTATLADLIAASAGR